ncbi:AAA family ATPase [bacterium]|nr:AAA family ATPase [bacterium]
MVNDIFTFKYKPKLLKEFYINSNLLEILTTFIQIEKITLLLNGNSGSGKTSLINAVIKEYYIDYQPNDYLSNILFINTLKEQGISYYRTEVKLFCQTPSLIKNKKKILVLDDLDLINEQGQQVFRNCIDKYSNNIFFIASCSNIHKIIESVQSRMDIINIKPYSKTQLSSIALNIINKENIHLDDDILPFILDWCNNSVRILVNYLEKFKLIDKQINLKLAYILCSNISYTEFENYTISCINGDLIKAINIIGNLSKKGFSNSDILDNYFTYIKISNLINESIKYEIISYICKYITIFNILHEDENELIFFTNNIIQLFKLKCIT